jgi:hypothetical protein
VPTRVDTHAAPDGPVRISRSDAICSRPTDRYVELPDGQALALSQSTGGRWRGARWRGEAKLQEAVADSPSALVAELTGRRSAQEDWIRVLEVWLLAEAEVESRNDIMDVDSLRQALPGIIELARRQAEANAAVGSGGPGSNA